MPVLPLTGLRGIAFRSGYSLRALRGNQRTVGLCRARWACWAEGYSLGYSLTEIGRFFRKDHTTVLNGIRRHFGMPPRWRTTVDARPNMLSLFLAGMVQGAPLASLSDEDTERASRMFRWQRMDTVAIAKAIGATEAAVHNSLHQARERVCREAEDGERFVVDRNGRETAEAARRGA